MSQTRTSAAMIVQLSVLGCVGLAACNDSHRGPTEARPVCTGVPVITPSPLPVLALGKSTQLTFTATCESDPVLTWRSSDTTVMRVVGTGGLNAVVTARSLGTAAISARSTADTTFRATAQLKSEAAYALVSVAGAPLPATVTLGSLDVYCGSASGSRAIYKSGHLLMMADSTFRTEFAWTRTCDNAAGSSAFDESATGLGRIVISADSLSFEYTQIISPNFALVCSSPCMAGGGRSTPGELNLAFRAPGFIGPQAMIFRQQ